MTDADALISTRVQECFGLFKNACASLCATDETMREKLPPQTVEDETGRFRLWCGNVGAHKKGKSSLDYKLREASHIREGVIDLLENLKITLEKACEIFQGVRPPWEDMPDNDSVPSVTEDDEDEGETELQQLIESAAEAITCLMRLSVAMQNPAPHDQFKGASHIDTTCFEPFDIAHVREKFPNAAEYLTARLGKAISRRRQYLRYREELRKKLGHGLEGLHIHHLDGAEANAARTIARSEWVQSTVASSIAAHLKGGSIQIETSGAGIEAIDDVVSQTSYASSFNHPAQLKPPPLPKEGQDGSPFECPICYRLTSALNTTCWYRHVYRDLAPYICAFKDCEIPDHSYDSQHVWFKHELQCHRKFW